MKPRLTWRKQPNETGLRSIGQGPRGAILRVTVGDVREDVAHVSANRIGMAFEWRGWRWSARSDKFGVPLHNTAAAGRKPYTDIDAAKRDAEDYVRGCLGARDREPARAGEEG